MRALSSPPLEQPHDASWANQTLLGTQKEVGEANSFDVSPWRTCLCVSATMIPRVTVILAFCRPCYSSGLGSLEELQHSPDNSLSLSSDVLG